MADPLRDPSPEEALEFWKAYSAGPELGRSRYPSHRDSLMHALRAFMRKRRAERLAEEETV